MGIIINILGTHIHHIICIINMYVITLCIIVTSLGTKAGFIHCLTWYKIMGNVYTNAPIIPIIIKLTAASSHLVCIKTYGE